MLDAIKALLGWEKKPEPKKRPIYREPENTTNDQESASIYNHLEQMGRSANEVAAFLQSHNIKGKERDCFDCPVATWVKSILPNREGYRTNVIISDSGYSISYSNLNDKYDFVIGPRGKLTPALADFVHRFDYMHQYNELRTS